MNNSREQRGEHLFGDAEHKAREILQQWNSRLTLDNRRFAERYLNSELRVLAHCVLDGQQVVACFQRAPDAAGLNETSTAEEFNSSGRRESCESQRGRNQEAVLVEVVQLVENPKVVSVPTLVWFKCPKCFYLI